MARKTDLQGRQQRRMQILAAAAQVFSQTGYTRSTTLQIAEAAGVSEGLLYTYFENKESLLFALMDLLAGTQQERVAKSGQNLTAFMANELVQISTGSHLEDALITTIISEAFFNPRLRQEYRTRLMDPWLNQCAELLETPPTRGGSAADADAQACFWLAELTGLRILQLLGSPQLQPETLQLERVIEKARSFMAGELENPGN